MTGNEENYYMCEYTIFYDFSGKQKPAKKPLNKLGNIKGKSKIMSTYDQWI